MDLYAIQLIIFQQKILVNLGLNKIKQNKGYLFEVETDNGQITKAVYRVAYNNNYDMCIVVRYRLIVTAWTNKNTDTHTTLDSDKYIKG